VLVIEADTVAAEMIDDQTRRYLLPMFKNPGDPVHKQAASPIAHRAVSTIYSPAPLKTAITAWLCPAPEPDALHVSTKVADVRVIPHGSENTLTRGLTPV
jgi:hypothetical protein